MNYRITLKILSRVAMSEAALLFVSALVGLIHGEAVLLPYGVPVALLLLIFFALGFVKPRSKDFYARDGFVTVALAWVFVSVFGALPFWLGGAIPSYIDSLFETVSGFTTTGATLLSDIEAMPKGLLFWRSLTHWIGGMGVLVFLMAVVQLAGDRSMYLMRAEAPGPTAQKLVPRLRASAGILYGIYISLTLLQCVLLILGGMPVFDSVTTAFSTAGTGGFGVKNAGILAYESAYIEIVLTVFMLIFSVNFTLYYSVLTGKPSELLRSEELRWYLGLFLVSTVLVAVNILPQSRNAGEAVRLAAFQNASIMSTTGFATADFNQWPELSHAIMILLMIIGACAGSTGGGFKVSRVVILLKHIRREVSRMLHPRSVSHIKFEGKTVEPQVGNGVLVFLALYVVIIIAGTLLIALNGFDHITNFTAVLTTLNNVGPGLGLVGPMDNFSIFSPFSKLVLSALMLIGRLEIFPMLLLLAPSVWRRK